MLKKILYVLASFMIGFLLITNVIYYNFYSVFHEFVEESVIEKDYMDAERYFSRVIDSGSKFVKDFDNVHIEIYYALNDEVHYLKDEEGKNTEVNYYTLESGIQFSLFHLPEDFKLVDDEGKQGGVSLVFENGELFFPFKTDIIDYYSFVESYAFLPFNISYNDYTVALDNPDDNIDASSVIKSVKFIDGSGVEKYLFDLSDSNLTFNNQLHLDFDAVLTEYNQVQKEAAEGKELNEDVATSIKDRYNAILDNNENYLLQHDVNLIYGSFDFLFTVILAAVIFLAVDIVVAWLLFRKKKPVSYIPPYQRKQNGTTQPQPEQFNRDVFNVEEEDIVVEENNETVDE